MWCRAVRQWRNRVPPSDPTSSRSEARQIYNALGAGLDGAARYEAQARARAIAALGLAHGQRVLQVGVGTGGAHRARDRAVMPGGRAVGLDLSRVMRDLTRRRTAAPLCAGDAVALPFAARCFDRLFSASLLDLLPTDELPRPGRVRARAPAWGARGRRLVDRGCRSPEPPLRRGLEAPVSSGTAIAGRGIVRVTDWPREKAGVRYSAHE